MNLAACSQITAGEIEILGHDAEIHVSAPRTWRILAERFLHTQVRPGIAVAVVTGEEHSVFRGRPALAEASSSQSA